MKNKGFTLIELLAVIVILAIIALIATPMILGVIDTAKRGSAESAALGYVDAVEKSIMLNQVNGGVAPAADEYTISANGKTLTSKNKTYKNASGATVNYVITVDFKGEAPTGTVTIDAKNQVSTASLTFAKIIDKVVTYNITATKKATVAS